MEKTRAQARLVELAVAKQTGKLVPVDMVLALEQMRATELRNQIQSVPGRFAPRIVGIKQLPLAQEALRAIVNELLENLGRTGALIRDRVLQQQSAPARPVRRRRRRPHKET